MKDSEQFILTQNSPNKIKKLKSSATVTKNSDAPLFLRNISINNHKLLHQSKVIHTED